MQISFSEKFIFLLIGIVLASLFFLFAFNDKNKEEVKKNKEDITIVNINTYDEDVYVYKLDSQKIYTSKYFFNKLFLNDNTVSLDEYNLSKDFKPYLRTLTNTKNDINNIKISIDPITIEQFEYILENYNILKVYIWFNEKDECKNIVLYSPNNIDIELID